MRGGRAAARTDRRSSPPPAAQPLEYPHHPLHPAPDRPPVERRIAEQQRAPLAGADGVPRERDRGDRMLREVAALVQAQLREYDFLARYAGDEFVAIVPDMAIDQVAELRERTERIVSAFSIEVRAKGRARVGISLGSAVFGVDGETLDQLVIAADQAMYRAKSQHKTGFLRTANIDSSSLKPLPEHRTESRLVTTAIN